MICSLSLLFIYVASYSVSVNASTPSSPIQQNKLWDVKNRTLWNIGESWDGTMKDRAVRSIGEPTRRSCSVLVGIDEPVYRNYGGEMPRLVAMVSRHFEKVNRLFKQQVFTGPWEGVYFTVGRVYVVFNSCDGVEGCFYEEAGDFLDVFDRHGSTKFCLSYIFTNRKFKKVVGMAWVGTICRKKTNSGFVTGNFSGFEDTGPAVTTLAHELGHSLGAIHDQEIACCGTGFIMSGGDREFSKCSIESMHYKLKEVTTSKINCLHQEEGRVKRSIPEETFGDNVNGIETAICGNQVLEPGEECDCGYDRASCQDPCCYPAIISASARTENSTALQCSRNARRDCFSPPGLVFGVYVPWAFIGTMVVLLGVVLAVDWYGGRRLYRHVTKPEGDVRINAGARSPTFVVT